MENNKTFINKRRIRKIVIQFSMMACLSLPGIAAKCQETLTIICNQSGTPDAMKFTELKSVMKGEKQRWSSGAKVTVALMNTNTPLGKNTARVIYNMSANELQKFNLSQHFQGTSLTKFFNTTTELESYVAENPGAIGVVDQALATNDVKIMTIDGKTRFSL